MEFSGINWTIPNPKEAINKWMVSIVSNEGELVLSACMRVGEHHNCDWLPLRCCHWRLSSAPRELSPPVARGPKKASKDAQYQASSDELLPRGHPQGPANLVAQACSKSVSGAIYGVTWPNP